ASAPLHTLPLHDALPILREAAHVAAALHIVLSTQRIYADTAAADIAGGHGKIGDRHDSRAALAVLRHAEAIVDRTVPAGGVEARSEEHTSELQSRRDIVW